MARRKNICKNMKNKKVITNYRPMNYKFSNVSLKSYEEIKKEMQCAFFEI